MGFNSTLSPTEPPKSDENVIFGSKWFTNKNVGLPLLGRTFEPFEKKQKKVHNLAKWPGEL